MNSPQVSNIRRIPRAAVAGVPPGDGTALVEVLQALLYALIDLQLSLKHAHWNALGPHFLVVHELLDTQAAGIQAMSDDVAERIATLGGVAHGTPGALVESRAWGDYDLDRADAITHLAVLDLMYAHIITDVREAMAASGMEPVTEDLLISRLRRLEKFQWLVRAHLDAAPASPPAAGFVSQPGV